MNARLKKVALAIAIALVPTAAPADTVTQWNQTADTLTPLFPALKFRILGMVQGAVHDALNSIEPRYDSYLSIPAAAPGASADAAVGAAAYRVLSQTMPSPALELAYTNWFASLPACPPAYPGCITDGLATGNVAGDAYIAARTGDGSATPHLPYTVPAGTGNHQPTPPNLPAPQWNGWGLVKPFVVRSASQFRPDPAEMMEITNEDYTRDFNEVKRVGAVGAEAAGHRTPRQTETARYIAGGAFNPNHVARTALLTRDQGMWGNARLFAVLNMALHDVTVTMFEAKYYYNFWRPITAIRAADTDGNPDTAGDPGWLSLITTPPYPDYPSGLCSHVGAGAEVLRRYFGTNDLGFTATVVLPTGPVTRTYANLTEIENDAVDARVFAGIHFRTADVTSIRMGAQVGRFVLQHALRPVRPGGH